MPIYGTYFWNSVLISTFQTIMGWTPILVLQQAMDQARLDESESIARGRQARRRVRLRKRATRVFTEKSLGRMVRPMIQADLE